jgi:hypothetical protein
MAVINFPLSPSLGQTYSFNGTTWVYNGYAWVFQGASVTNGTSGTSGKNGTSGTSGGTGIAGTSGTSGVNGTSGSVGTSGTSGLGFSSLTGSTGYIPLFSSSTGLTASNIYQNPSTSRITIGGTGDNGAGILQTAGNIVPTTTTTYDLGSFSYKWNQSYIGGTAYFGGNVGIGTTAPQATTATRRALVISDTVNDTTLRLEASNSVVVEVISTNSTGGIGTRSNTNFGVFTNNTNRLTVDQNGLILLGSGSPTHTLTLPSTSTGIVLYNSTDQTTNYQRFRQYWGANIQGQNAFYSTGEIGGTANNVSTLFGTRSGQNAITFHYTFPSGTANNTSVINLNPGSGIVQWQPALYSGSVYKPVILFNGTVTGLTAQAGNHQYLQISPTVNVISSSTVGASIVRVSPYMQSVGSTATYFLLDAGTNTASDGLGTHSPVFTVDTVGNIVTSSGATNGHIFYNTTDQTTNYERLRQYWSGNAFYLATEQGGTGASRTINFIQATQTKLSIGSTQVIGAINIGFNSTTAGSVLGLSPTLGVASGIQSSLAIIPTINQSGNAGSRGIWISPYIQASGTAGNTLIDIGTNSAANGSGTHTSSFIVNSLGNILIGTNTDGGYKLQVNGTSYFNAQANFIVNGAGVTPMYIQNLNTQGVAAVNFYTSGATNTGAFGYAGSAYSGTNLQDKIYLYHTKDFIITPDGSTVEFKIFKLNGNVVIGATSDNGSKFQVNGSSHFGGGTATKGGAGTGDLLLDNGSNDTPGILLYYANNSNWGIDSWNGSYDVLSGQLLRVTNNLNESTGSMKAAFDTSGNMVVNGFVKPNAWRAGQVVQDIMLSNTEVTVSTTTIATSTSDTDFVTYSYTPLSSSSYLVIHYHLASYDASAGTGNDSWFSRIKVDGTEITYAHQSTVNGNRSGVLFPLTGRYTNSSTTAKSIVVACRRDSADDSINIVNTATSMWLRITEIAR